MHSDLLTRVERSANTHRDRPGLFERKLELVIADKPPVAGKRTDEEEAAARLAHLEEKRAAEHTGMRGIQWCRDWIGWADGVGSSPGSSPFGSPSKQPRY